MPFPDGQGKAEDFFIAASFGGRYTQGHCYLPQPRKSARVQVVASGFYKVNFAGAARFPVSQDPVDLTVECYFISDHKDVLVYGL